MTPKRWEPRRRVRLTAARIVLSALLGQSIGCAAPDAFNPDGAVVRDSAGIRIITTPAALARAPRRWMVDPEPDLVIGREGIPEYQFTDIRGVHELADGRILIVDGATAEIRFFDPEGGFLNAVGGKGDGPGEFQRPTLVPELGRDSILIFDDRLSRFTRLSGTGSVARTLSPTVRLRGTPVGFTDSRVLMQSPALIFRLGDDGAQPIIPAEFTLVDPTSGESDTVSVLEGTQLVSASLHAGHPPSTFPNPFRVVPAAALGPNGFVVTAARAPEIIEYDLAGAMRRVLRIDEAPRTITARDLDEAAERQAADLGESDPTVVARLREAMGRFPRPDVFPAFRRLIVDSEAWVWAEVHRLGATPFEVLLPNESIATAWLVFDPEGQAVGIVETPPGLYIREIGRNRVLGIHVDELGVQTVRRHRLDRGK